MMSQYSVIRENVFRFKRFNLTIVNGATIKILVILFKANIIGDIIYLMILIIHALFHDPFIKAYVIIQNKEWLICHSILKELNNDSGIILERPTSNFSRYHNSHLI